jgi:hypothetical protein
LYDRKGVILGDYVDTDMEAILLARQRRLAVAIQSTSDYTVPKNVRVFLEQGFVWNQIAVKKPWAVYFLINGTRRRKRFNNLREAILFHKKYHEKYPASGIVSLCHAYELPARYRESKERLFQKYKWCPQCATFRVFNRLDPPETMFAMVKRWSASKGRYEYTDRKIWVTECQLCGHTNRSTIFRRANQHFEVRQIKQGARRVKARADTKAIASARAREVRRRRAL